MVKWFPVKPLKRKEQTIVVNLFIRLVSQPMCRLSRLTEKELSTSSLNQFPSTQKLSQTILHTTQKLDCPCRSSDLKSCVNLLRCHLCATPTNIPRITTVTWSCQEIEKQVKKLTVLSSLWISQKNLQLV